MRTSEVASAAGVNVQTLRYYERRGLLPQPERTLGGHRLYPASTVVTVRTIKAAQRLGFTLDEVGELVASRTGPGLQERVVTKLTQIEARIAELRVVAADLGRAVEAGCDDLTACATTPECPIGAAHR